MSKHCLTCGKSTQPVSQVLCGNCLRAKEKHRSVFIDSLLHYCILPWDTMEVFLCGTSMLKNMTYFILIMYKKNWTGRVYLPLICNCFFYELHSKSKLLGALHPLLMHYPNP